MTTTEAEERVIEALYAITDRIEKARADIEFQLGKIVAQLEDMNGYLSAIDKAMPNPLDTPE